jgi:hypothetical protein
MASAAATADYGGTDRGSVLATTGLVYQQRGIYNRAANLTISSSLPSVQAKTTQRIHKMLIW